MMPKLLCSIAALSWLLIACDDAPLARQRPMLPDSDGEEREGPQFAVISGDFSVTSVSLLDAELEVVADDYINSGSTEAGLVTALSGDVEMPTRSGEDGVLVLIDRFKTDVITRIELSDGEVLDQIKTHSADAGEGEGAFSSNPNDYLRVDDDTAWVTRNQPNIDPDADALDLGNDLFELDPSTGGPTGERIDLSSLDTTATQVEPESGQERDVEIYARPSRMARIGDTLIVGLARASYDFTTTGDGMVAVVDLETQAVTGLEIEDLNGCTYVLPIPNASDRVLVGCTGAFPAPEDTAGAAIVSVASGEASVVRSWKARDHEDTPALSGSFISLGGTLIAAAVNNFAGGDDSVFGTLNLETGDFTELKTIPGGEGTFGTPLYDVETGNLLVPDASVDSDMRPTAGVRVFTLEGDTFEEGDPISVAEDSGLPARHVFPL